ncbi:hypothetical protein CLV46_0391 [Diaminobutyricimonas aerilata]|uniref:Excreted virulence factor EspC (Type VII ESX diderm) n=1 Tax=Diaminobutyricimonas aerilata TaxID=1162967 RepID=A0A2M9CG87_9MICO|nr:hypothetical protein [Diaminobutyricimonas aerilata]PJJ70862.1 hypothetical protein CLV46_0391 [Diaminobutyricimonas aerilata]
MDVELDLDALDDLRGELVTVADGLRGNERFGRDAADAAAHPELARALHEYVTNWDIRRDDLLEAVSLLGDTVQAIVESFRDLDRTAGAALDEAVPQFAVTPSATVHPNPAAVLS